MMSEAPLPSRKPTAIALLVAGSFFMENLDGTVIATALPQMGRSFHVNPVDLNIGMTAYLLMLAVFIPISGWFADRFGARTVFVSAIVVFTLSSILCGLSNGLWQFTAARVIQGIGSAMGALAILHFRRAPAPLINLISLKMKTFAITIGGGSLFRIAISVSPFLLPLMFQVGFGLNAFQSGLLMLGLFAGNLGMKTVTTPVLRRFGFRKVLIVNGILTALLMLGCASLTPHTPRIAILAVLFVNGLCRSMQFTSLSTIAFADIPKPQMSSATSFSSMVTQLSMG